MESPNPPATSTAQSKAPKTHPYLEQRFLAALSVFALFEALGIGMILANTFLAIGLAVCLITVPLVIAIYFSPVRKILSGASISEDRPTLTELGTILGMLYVLPILAFAVYFKVGYSQISSDEPALPSPPAIATDHLGSTSCAALKPNLRLIMFGANIFVPDAAPSFTGVEVDAEVWDTGAPSAATSWTLEAVPQSGQPVFGQFTKQPPTLTLNGQHGGDVIHDSEALDQKAGQQNITSVPIRGSLLFYFPIAKDVIQNPTTKLILTVEDICGSKFDFVQKMGDWMSR